eukprot:TRINITY_DN3680_c0_g1_i1.p1 TRINITY_DN3680_c0_g1~~TRINITY_DN3680_c0_g1_i1.p1  ORF type:complete len:923 (+),score=244.37 TRINITY_DN3680_c0_g1_i1:1806-4574(+)
MSVGIVAPGILSTPRPQGLPAFFSDVGSGLIEEELGGLDEEEDILHSDLNNKPGSLPQFFASDGAFLDDVLETGDGELEDGYANGYRGSDLDHEAENELPESVFGLVLDEDDAEDFSIGSQYGVPGRSRGLSDAGLPSPYSSAMSSSVGRDSQSIWAGAAPTSPALAEWNSSPGRQPARNGYPDMRQTSPGFSSVDDEVVLPRPRTKDTVKVSAGAASAFMNAFQMDDNSQQHAGYQHSGDDGFYRQQHELQQPPFASYGAGGYMPDQRRPQQQHGGGYYGEPQQRERYAPAAPDTSTLLGKLFGSSVGQHGPPASAPNGVALPKAPKVMSLDELEARLKANAQPANLPVPLPTPPLGLVPGSLPLPVPLPNPSGGAMQAQLPHAPSPTSFNRPPMSPMGHLPHRFMPPMAPSMMGQLSPGPMPPPPAPQHHWLPPGHPAHMTMPPAHQLGMLPMPPAPFGPAPTHHAQQGPMPPFRGPPPMMPNGRPAYPQRGMPFDPRGPYDPRGPPPPFPYQQMQQMQPQQQYFRSPQPQQQQHQRSRPPQRESKMRMSADEIEQILRMQEYQLTSQASNLFAEDYYCQTYLARKNVSQPDSRSGRSEYVLAHHKPLVESHPRPMFRRQGADPFEGALGRIPAHSVRAPRALLQLKPMEPSEIDSSNDMQTASSKEIHSLLLAIEQSYNLLLDIEDIDNILRSADQSSANVNVTHLRQKREEIVTDLYASLRVNNFSSVPHVDPRAPEPTAYLHAEDGVFTTLSAVSKGRKLLVRALPLFSTSQLVPILLQYLRNLSVLVASIKHGKESSSASKVFGYMTQLISIGAELQTILSLQTVLGAHTNDQLLKILRSKLGCSVVHAVLHRAHELNLSPFSREDAAPASLDTSNPLAAYGFSWYVLSVRREKCVDILLVSFVLPGEQFIITLQF